MRWVQVISREGQGKDLEPSETVRRILTTKGEAKIQSELLGDQERQAEMTCPSPARLERVTTLSVPIHCGRRRLEGSCS
jgi:hypothetical protein